jgi:ABC-type Mn2+/Zn2+ transport system ATPase subunit
MKLQSFSLENQYRFLSTGSQPIAARRTAIVGQNNAGKSALIRSLAPDTLAIPLRTSKDRPEDIDTKRSRIEQSYSFAQDELRSLVSRRVFKFLASKEAMAQVFRKKDPKIIDGLLATCLIEGNREKSGPSTFLPKYFNGGESRDQVLASVHCDNESDALLLLNGAGTGALSLEEALGRRISSGFHRFSAERLNVGSALAAPIQPLQANCANLATYLDHIMPNPEWDLLESSLREVIPSISKISVRPNPGDPNIREIVLWTSSAPRGDLAIPLSDAGTGVGQALAILSVVLTSLEPKLILIDEPNSFLHPGAAKRLLSILAEDTRHQFVITTHSIETLRWFDPEIVLFLKPNGDATDIEPHSWRDLLSSRVFMSELGISYGDVTGADHCVWVEGQTEAEVFPLIARHFFKKRANTLAFPRVGSTGQFERRAKLSKAEILEVYSNLSKAVTLLPDTLAFIFDREARSNEDCADLKRQMRDKVEYLPRYCFENYLLEWGAIAETLNEKPTFKAAPTKPADIEAWVTAKAADRKYWPNDIVPKPLNDNNWRVDIRAAELLADMFADLSGGKEKYQKTVDSVAIAKWLLERRPEVFKEIADIIERFLPKSSAR